MTTKDKCTSDRVSAWCTIGRFAFFVFLMSAFEHSANAQDWLLPRNYNSVSLEVLKPFFDGDEFSFATAAAVLSGQLALDDAQRTFLVADVPISHAANDDSKTDIGNPYVGVLAFSRNSPTVVELGIRAPLASNFLAHSAGFWGDVDRFEAFLPDQWSVSGSFIYFPSRTGPAVFLTRLTPKLTLDTDKDRFESTGELYLGYAAQAWFFGSQVQGGLGFTGRWLITEEGSFGQRTVHQIGGTVQVDLGAIIPGLHFRLPLDDDLSDIVDYVVGLNVIVPVQ